MTPLTLDPARREELILETRGYFRDEFDEELSAFRAGELVDFFLKRLGPAVYNQAVQDARAFMQKRLDDLDGDVYADPEA